MHPRPRVAAASAAASRTAEQKKPFVWQLREASLALAPWTSDARQQEVVSAAVSVAEQSAPQYALTFAVSVLLQQSHLTRTGGSGGGRNGQTGFTESHSAQVVRKVTKQHMVSAFERAVSGREEDEHFARLETRRLGCEHLRTPRAIDDAVRLWLLRGEAAPSHQETALWLLSRMLLVRSGAVGGSGERAWELLICGEAGAEVQRPIEVSASLKTPQRGGGGAAGRSREERSGAVRGPDCDDGEEDPPEYREASHPTNESDASSGEGADSVYDDEYGEVTSNDEFEFDAASCGDERVAPGETPEVPQPDSDAGGRHHLSHSQLTAVTKSKFAFEPAAVRTRHRSSSVSRTSRSASELDDSLTNEWTQDRKSFELELHKSQKDIRAARELQHRTEAVARARKQQLLTQRQRKLRAHDQRREDASRVAQLVSDTLEYHEIFRTLEAQVKRTQISAKREQERLTHSMRVAIGRSDKHIKGPILGPGPLSQLEIDALGRSGRRLSGTGRHQQQQDRADEGDPFVYDLHGRRHAAEDAGDVAALGVFETAMRKIKRALGRRGAGGSSSDLVQLFRAFDADRSGTLSHSEFERVLGACGVTLSREQVLVLLQHFDSNGSGEVDYGELLWGFFNRRAFLKRWQLRKTSLSPRDVKLLFYQYDRAGRGALAPRDFQLAMDDLGFQLADDELALLTLKFDVNHDGFLDYHEFHAFVSDGGDVGAADVKESGGGRSGDVAATTPRERSGRERRREMTRSDSKRDDGQTESAERILAELRALSETQTRIRQSIR